MEFIEFVKLSKHMITIKNVLITLIKLILFIRMTETQSMRWILLITTTSKEIKDDFDIMNYSFTFHSLAENMRTTSLLLKSSGSDLLQKVI